MKRQDRKKVKLLPVRRYKRRWLTRRMRAKLNRSWGGAIDSAQMGIGKTCAGLVPPFNSGIDWQQVKPSPYLNPP